MTTGCVWSLPLDFRWFENLESQALEQRVNIPFSRRRRFLDKDFPRRQHGSILAVLEYDHQQAVLLVWLDVSGILCIAVVVRHMMKGPHWPRSSRSANALNVRSNRQAAVAPPEMRKSVEGREFAFVSYGS